MAIVAENQYRAEGDVRFMRSDQHMWSEVLVYDAEAAEGRIDVPLRFQDRDMLATASSARWSESGDSRLEDVQFQLRSGRGNGHADARSADVDYRDGANSTRRNVCRDFWWSGHEL